LVRSLKKRKSEREREERDRQTVQHVVSFL
jgi:hypothetical protein